MSQIDIQQGKYDHVKCPVCGVPLEQHTSLCSRHAFIEMPHIARQRERQREYDARHGAKTPASPVDKAVTAEAEATRLRNGTANATEAAHAVD
jgi:predicted nucleic acid-binding Zn ribbon protein